MRGPRRTRQLVPATVEPSPPPGPSLLSPPSESQPRRTHPRPEGPAPSQPTHRHRLMPTAEEAANQGSRIYTQRRDAASRSASCSAGLSWRRSPRRNQCTERQTTGAEAGTGTAAAIAAANRRPGPSSSLASAPARRGLAANHRSRAGAGGAPIALYRPQAAMPGAGRVAGDPSHPPPWRYAVQTPLPPLIRSSEQPPTLFNRF